MRILKVTPRGVVDFSDNLQSIIQLLKANIFDFSRLSVYSLLDFFDNFGKNLLDDSNTRSLEGVMFLSNWLRKANLERMLKLNLNGNLDYVDGFIQYNRNFLTAKPAGLVCMWMAGNVPTLPVFSFIPALLAKNVVLVKLAYPEPDGMDKILSVLANTKSNKLSGDDILRALSVIWYDFHEGDLNEEMSRVADVKVMWGGEAAIKGITSLPRKEHCSEVIFGPKYSFGVIGKKILNNEKQLDSAISAFVRDIAIFDQRACSSPQTIFIETNDQKILHRIGEKFATQFTKLPPKPGLDAYTTIKIMNARSEWAIHEERDVIASQDGANWTVCMDSEVSFKDAIQSRTIFLTKVDSWKQIIPLINHKIQTIGIVFAEESEAIAFADEASLAGAVRCVRPGLMNLYESPWDGKLIVNELVRWITLKP